LALIGKYLERIKRNALVDAAYLVRTGIASGDLVECFLSLSCLSRNNFAEHVRQRQDVVCVHHFRHAGW